MDFKKSLIFLSFLFLFSLSLVVAQDEVSYLSPTPANDSNIMANENGKQDITLNASINSSSVAIFTIELYNSTGLIGYYGTGINTAKGSESIADLNVDNYKARVNVSLQNGSTILGDWIYFNITQYYGLHDDAYFDNNVLVLDGEGDYYNIDPTMVSAEDMKTISLWVKFNDKIVNGTSCFDTWHKNCSQELVAKSKDSHGVEVLLYDNQLKFYVMGYNASLNKSQYEESIGANISNVSDLKWHHIVATHNGPNSEMRLYIDNVLIGNGTTPARISNELSALYYGSWDQRNTNYFWCGQRYLNGSLDEVMIFNRTLNESEIGELFNTNRGNFTGNKTGIVIEDSFGGVEDRTAPQFTYIPADADLTEGDNLNVDFNATDDNNFSWSVNDTQFIIDENGTLTNNGTLAVGTYSTLVSVKDVNNNSNSTVYTITVTAPAAPAATSSRGGSGGGRVTELPDQWTCTEWSECDGEKETRVCTETTETSFINMDEPETERACTIELNPEETQETNEEETEEEGFFSPLTAAVIGTTGGRVGLGIVLLLLALGLAYWYVAAKKKKAKK